jgi:hypothetical protein
MSADVPTNLRYILIAMLLLNENPSNNFLYYYIGFIRSCYFFIGKSGSLYSIKINLLRKSYRNKNEALYPGCNHSLGRHKIRIPHHCTEKLWNCKLSRLEAKTNYFKWFMKERRNQKTIESFLDLNDA